MYILINQQGRLSLEQHNDMKQFSIVDHSKGKHQQQFLEIAEPAEENHYWINAEPVIDLSPANSDPGWRDDFWAMLKSVEKYGYSDLKNKRIKAHVEKNSD